MSYLQRARRVVTAKPWLTAVLVVILAGAVSGYLLLTGGGSDTPAAAAATTSRLVSVSTGTVSKSVSTTGNLTPSQDKDVSFGSSATITSVRVAQGARVRQGQILGTIDTLSLRAALAETQSSLASARATSASAKESDDTTSAQLRADRAGITTAKQSVAAAREALADAVLRSPIAGVVAEVNVAKGDQSGGGSGSAGSGSGTTATGSGNDTTTTATTGTSSTSSSDGDFVIVGTKQWKVSVDVDDTEIGLIAKGQQVQLTTDNHSGMIFGTVTAVSVLSSSTSGSASYPVTVSVTGSPSGLHDGAEATVAIIYRQATNVLTVASAAVHTDGDSSYVYLSSDGKRAKQTVKTGLSSVLTTQITSGLTSGEQVYVDVVTPGPGTAGTIQRTGNQTGGFPGGGTGGFPGGGTGGFPGGGAGGFPGGGGGGS